MTTKSNQNISKNSVTTNVSNVSESILEKVRSEIKRIKELQETREALLRLRQNPDFKLVIEKGYCQDHLTDLTKSLAVISSQDSLGTAHRAIAGIGVLQYYLDCIEHKQGELLKTLDDLYEAEEQILAGKLDQYGNLTEDDAMVPEMA